MYAIACPGYAPTAALDVQDEMENTADKFSLKELIGDGILWAVPKHRKSLERRLKAKFGHPLYHVKTIPVKTTLRICMQCGHDHEVGILCRKCRLVPKLVNSIHKHIRIYSSMRKLENQLLLLDFCVIR